LVDEIAHLPLLKRMKYMTSENKNGVNWLSRLRVINEAQEVTLPLAELRAIPGTHGKFFNVLVDGKLVAATKWGHLREVFEQQVAKRPMPPIPLGSGSKLAIYKSRPDSDGETFNRDPLLSIDAQGTEIWLSPRAACDTAFALLAYAGEGWDEDGNSNRNRWLLRVESGKGQSSA
jgi:hypothetical protein